MIPVPSYQLIPFLAWLQHRGVRLSVQRADFERLRESALEFLQTSSPWTLDGLAGLMMIFQECPMIGESDIEAQMSHFAGCGQCIGMMANREAPRPRERPRQGDRWQERDKELVDLHSLLRGFVEWARNSQLESQLRFWSERHPQDWDRSHEAFQDLIHRVGGELREYFLRYLAEIREREPGLIQSYESWRRSEERQRPGWPGLPGDRRRSEENTQPLGPNEPLNQAAQRLADSVRLAIESGFYDERIAEEPQFAHLMALAMESPEHLVQALEFLNWLRHREPEDRLETASTVPLQGLDHDDVVDVVKTIVQAIRDDCAPSEIV